eukprot:scaffold11660_cov62-Cyclotella_meneghiniana.AAC.1
MVRMDIGGCDGGGVVIGIILIRNNVIFQDAYLCVNEVPLMTRIRSERPSSSSLLSSVRRFLLGGELLGEGSSREEERGEDGPLWLCDCWRWGREGRCFLRTGLMMGGVIKCLYFMFGRVNGSGRMLLLFRNMRASSARGVSSFTRTVK